MSAAEALAVAFLESHPADAGPELERVSSETAAEMLARLSPAGVAGALLAIEPGDAAAILAHVEKARRAEVLTELPLWASARMLRTVSVAERERWLEGGPPDAGRALRAALTYAEGTAGALMDADVVTLPAEMPVDEARRRIGRSRRVGNYVYVVDDHGRPVGALTVGQLVRGPSEEPLGTVMETPIVSVRGRTPVEIVLEHPGWQRLHAIPVVDATGVLIGVLRRESYERLRTERAERGDQGAGGIGLPLVELAWVAATTAVDELVRGLRKPSRSDAREDRG